MGNIFKKIKNIVHPGSKLFMDANEKKDSSGAWKSQGEQDARNAELSAAMKEYNDVPTMLRQNYLDASKRAGTYGNTAEFNSGLESEVVAGSRGARIGLASRINALKKALGHTDEFKPEGYQQTQAAATQATLTDNPLREDSGSGTGSSPALAASAPTSAAASSTSNAEEEGSYNPLSVQNATARKNALKKATNQG